MALDKEDKELIVEIILGLIVGGIIVYFLWGTTISNDTIILLMG